MAAREFPATDPVAQPEEEPFYAGLLVGELRVPWCLRCDRHVWRPKSHCTTCYGLVSEWRTLGGGGEVYSFCVIAKGEGGFSDMAPYVLAWVSIDGGPTILANIADDPDSVFIGMRVRIVAPGIDDGRRRGPVFSAER